MATKDYKLKIRTVPEDGKGNSVLSHEIWLVNRTEHEAKTIMRDLRAGRVEVGLFVETEQQIEVEM